MNGTLYLADGTQYHGIGFGKVGTAIGELVFNTSITGYQEILTDPSYAGQIITLTYPLIGNYGVNRADNESRKIHARGLVVKTISNHPSNYSSEQTVDEFLKQMSVVGVHGVDTRSITRKIRDAGEMKCAISTEDLSNAELKKRLDSTKIDICYMPEVSTKERMHIEGSGHRVVLLDFGVKNNIIENLKARNCDITVVPYDTPYSEIAALNPDGVLLSNGPGDPKTVTQGIGTIKEVINHYPTFGICFGHQLLALAVGGDTYKMKFGHHGGNHGVYDLERDKAFITSQNHGYAVDAESIRDKMTVTHTNLNDNTVEGMRHSSLPVFSIQFHPEGAPGPQDTAYLFDQFVSAMEARRKS